MIENALHRVDSEPAIKTKAARMVSIDTWRTISVFAVVLNHSMMNRWPARVAHPGDRWRLLWIIVTQGMRFAVPFFAITSGYFLGKKLRSTEDPHHIFSRYASRMLMLFVFWTVVYLVIPADLVAMLSLGWVGSLQAKIGHIMSNPLKFLLEGSRVHLWFLVSIIMSSYILTFFVARKREASLLLFAAVLYILGLIGGSYSSVLGHPHIRSFIDTRDGPFFTTLFVVFGWFLSSDKFSVKPLTAIGMIALGWSMRWIEIYALWKYFHVDPLMHDCLIGTVLVGLGLALLLFSWRDMGQSTPLPLMAKYVLGIYVSHFIFLDLMSPLKLRFEGIFMEVAYPCMVCALALILTIVCFRSQLLKKFLA